jgi:hypothetical protein
VTLVLIGLVALVSWRLARPRSRYDAIYREPYGDSFPVYPASHDTPFTTGVQQHHDA